MVERTITLTKVKVKVCNVETELFYEKTVHLSGRYAHASNSKILNKIEQDYLLLPGERVLDIIDIFVETARFKMSTDTFVRYAESCEPVTKMPTLEIE